MKIITNIFLVMVCFALIVSCKPKNEGNRQQMELGVMASMDYLPLAVAEREGYFEQEGLAVKLNKFYSANERDAAFQSKTINGCVIDYTGAILQKAGGMDLRLTSKCDAPFYIVAGKDSQITSLTDLKGKKVAISQNTVIDFVLDMALKSVNLSANDIEKNEVNKIPLRYELLRNGKIDATGLPNPFALMLKNEGYPVLTSNADLGFAITGIVFHKSYIDEHSEEVKKLYRAYNKGVDYLKSHSIADIKDILIKDLAFSEAIVDGAEVPHYTQAEMPSLEDLKLTADWLHERGLIEADFDSNSLLDNIVLSIDEEKQ